MDVRTHKADTPERFFHVSSTQLSIARHCGSITYNGRLYWYMPETDELIRDDVRKRDEKEKNQMAKSERERWTKARENQMPLF